MTITSLPKYFHYLSSPQALEAAKMQGSTLIWPFGACEQHGPHLPLATDNIFAEKLASAVLERLDKSLPIWMLPSQVIGFSPEHASFPGTISLSASLVISLVLEVGEQLASLGISRLVLFNAHGGQIGLLETAARELRAKSPEMAVLPCFIWRGVSEINGLLPLDEKNHDLHAGMAETSLMLSMSPELVGEERPIDGNYFSGSSKPQTPKGWSLEGDSPCSWLTKDVSISGVIGDSSKANKSLGDSIQNALIAHWESLLGDLMASEWPVIRD
tara:strand:+ start:189 stop:1004 length:816 start_codon:yes stop_codon:yes gene_type:complete